MGSLGTFVIQISCGTFKASRVVTPITEHLVFQRFANFWRVLLWISCPKRNFSPTICAPTKSWVVEKDEEMSQMWPSKVGGGAGGENEKSQNTWKTITQHPKKYLKVSLLPLWFKDDFEIIRLRSYSTLNHLNWTRNERVMSVESKRGRREEKRRKTSFITWKSLFFFLFFYNYSFASGVQWRIREL